MADKTILKQLSYAELKAEKRRQDKARKRFKDNLNANQNALCIDLQHLKELNRREWKHFIREGYNTFKEEDLRHIQINHDHRSVIMICQLICSIENLIAVSRCCC